MNGISEVFGALRLWAILPGILGSFFVFAGIIGFQKVGAAATIALLVASQLIAGLLVDTFKTDFSCARPSLLSFIGAGLLVVGAVLVARERI